MAKKKTTKKAISRVRTLKDPVSFELGALLPLGRTKKADSTVISVTPEMAEYWIIQYEYKGQRPYRDYWVATLTEELVRGRFHAGTQIRFAKNDGSYHLMDGQHRLMAIVASETAAECTLTINRTEGDAEEALLYSDIDRGLIRSPEDGYRAMDLQKDTGFTGMQIRSMHSGVGLMYQGFAHTKGKIPVGDTAAWILQWQTFGHAYFEAIQHGEKKIVGALHRGIPTAIGIITCKWCKAQAQDFWHQVSHDDGLQVGDPRKTLNRWLAEHTGKQQDQAISKVIKSPRHFALYIKRAWDNFYDGKNVKALRVLDFTAPIQFKGTPYDSAKRGFGL